MNQINNAIPRIAGKVKIEGWKISSLKKKIEQKIRIKPIKLKNSQITLLDVRLPSKSPYKLI